uniref:Glycerol-3-phosphate dehydrogenase isoform X1 n=1 Tax=Rhizophora mucronata TaxID=61149 RepID=A0A2P2QSW4_RHIMU
MSTSKNKLQNSTRVSSVHHSQPKRMHIKCLYLKYEKNTVFIRPENKSAALSRALCLGEVWLVFAVFNNG